MNKKTQGGGGSVGICGCFISKGTDFCYIYKNRMDQHQYIEVLENSFLPSVELLIDYYPNWRYQQEVQTRLRQQLLNLLLG